MITDLNSLNGRKYQCDICIVGTGAAGLALASELLNSGKSVILLESGAFTLEQKIQNLYRCEYDGLMFRGSYIGRKRFIGGSTNCWGGQLLPLEPMDFEPRTWVEHSGWPFGANELEPYYKKALQFTGADTVNFDTDLFKLFGIESPFDPALLKYHFSKWSPHRHLRELYLPQIAKSANVELLCHANLTTIQLSERHEQVEYLVAKNERLESFVIEASTVILCTGGIETARVLLSNNHQLPAGIGNANDLVGRFFQDHLFLYAGTLRSDNPQRIHDLFGSRGHENRGYTARFSLSPDIQKSMELLNSSAYIDFTFPPTVLRTGMVLNLLRESILKMAVPRGAISAALKLFISTLSLLNQRRRLNPRERFIVCLMCEQEPAAESRIMLGKSKDLYGIPRARIQWQPTQKTWKTMLAFARIIKDQFKKAGLGEIEFLPNLVDDCDFWRIYPADLYHHMGATRMAASADTGVVDKNCRVFGVNNLYVISSSVFPTSGHSNCTLTILALAFRLLAHLETKLPKPVAT